MRRRPAVSAPRAPWPAPRMLAAAEPGSLQDAHDSAQEAPDPPPRVDRPADRPSGRHRPQPRAGVLEREVGPHERDEEGEGDERVEAAERVLADPGDEAPPHGQARQREVRSREAEPEEDDPHRWGHGAPPGASGWRLDDDGVNI